MVRALALLALPAGTLGAKETTAVVHVQFFSETAGDTCDTLQNSGSSDPGITGWAQNSQFVKVGECHKSGRPGEEQSFHMVCTDTSVTISYFSDPACETAMESPGDNTELEIGGSCKTGSAPMAVGMKAVACGELMCEPCTESCMGATLEKMTCEAMPEGDSTTTTPKATNASGNGSASDRSTTATVAGLAALVVAGAAAGSAC